MSFGIWCTYSLVPPKSHAPKLVLRGEYASVPPHRVSPIKLHRWITWCWITTLRSQGIPRNMNIAKNKTRTWRLCPWVLNYSIFTIDCRIFVGVSPFVVMYVRIMLYYRYNAAFSILKFDIGRATTLTFPRKTQKNTVDLRRSVLNEMRNTVNHKFRNNKLIY